MGSSQLGGLMISGWQLSYCLAWRVVLQGGTSLSITRHVLPACSVVMGKSSKWSTAASSWHARPCVGGASSSASLSSWGVCLLPSPGASCIGWWPGELWLLPGLGAAKGIFLLTYVLHQVWCAQSPTNQSPSHVDILI
jgi:hypothetical protein